MSKERNSNIELLRIAAMSCVIFLHYFNARGGGASQYVIKGSINQLLLMIFEAIGVCAVDLFVMISGLFLSRSSKRSLGRALILIIQTSVYRIIYYFILCITRQSRFEPGALFRMSLPANWFVTLYIVVYLLSPLCNRAFKYKKKTVLFLFVLFSVCPFCVDVLQRVLNMDLNTLSTIGMYGSERGYTITNFFLCYFVGAYLNELDIQRHGNWKILLFLIADTAILTVWSYIDASTAREYCSPFVIAEAAAAVLLFLKFDLGRNKVINHISGAAFSVYILHGWFLRCFNVEKYVQQHFMIMIGHIILTIFVIITISFVIDAIYKKLFGKLNNQLKNFALYEL